MGRESEKRRVREENPRRAGKRSDMALLEVKKTEDGRILVRRKDGQPLTPEDREEAKRLAQERPPLCWNCGGITTETTDIYGETVWVCWSCAKWV
jgi:hypothetical protein